MNDIPHPIPTPNGKMTDDSDGAHGHALSAEERVAYVYRELKAVSPYVRRSMLVYNCVASDYTELDERSHMPVIRRVLWMTTSHPFFPVIQRLVQQQYPGAVVHRSSLAGIPMRGIDSGIIDAVADMIWGQFCEDTRVYPVYAEDGSPLDNVNLPRNEPPASMEEHQMAVAAGEPVEAPLEIVVDVSDVPLIGSDQHHHLYTGTTTPTTSATSALDHAKKE